MQDVSILGGYVSVNNIAERNYHQTSNMSRTLLGNKIGDHSDVVAASPAGAAPTTSSLLT